MISATITQVRIKPPMIHTQEELNAMQSFLSALPATHNKFAPYWYESVTRTINFENEEDAIIFKLKFGL